MIAAGPRIERAPQEASIGGRLSVLVSEAGRQIALLARQTVVEVPPEDERPEVSAIDGRMYKAQGPKRRKSDRQKDLAPVGFRNVDLNTSGPRVVIAVQGYGLVMQGLAFPPSAPIFAAWRPNNESKANIAVEALLAGALKVTDMLLDNETFGDRLFHYLYEEAGGWILSPKQLPQE